MNNLTYITCGLIITLDIPVSDSYSIAISGYYKLYSSSSMIINQWFWVVQPYIYGRWKLPWSKLAFLSGYNLLIYFIQSEFFFPFPESFFSNGIVFHDWTCYPRTG